MRHAPICLALLFSFLAAAQDWTQFRGPNATGVAAGGAPPVEFSPSKHLLWKQELPVGHSSPVIWGDRIFLTAFDRTSNKLELICLNRKDGAILWRRAAPAGELEKTHVISNPATGTPVVDAERVYAYFGSFGLTVDSHSGEPQWTLPLPAPSTNWGSGSSPVLAGDTLILNHDANEGGYLLAVDRKAGRIVWKQMYPPNMGRRVESYSTPVIWRDQIVMHRANMVDAYALKDGARLWSVPANTTGVNTPALNGDVLYAAAWNHLGELDQRQIIPTWNEMLEKYDKDGDGQLNASEMPRNLILANRPDAENVPNAVVHLGDMFSLFDANHDGILQKSEWSRIQTIFTTPATHGLLALQLDGAAAKILWRENIAIPEVPSPLYYKDRVFMVRNGGVVTCMDAGTGKVIYRARVGAAGPYFSSPVAAGGHVYVASSEGVISVLSAANDKMEPLAHNDLGEELYATPAVVGSTLYVRTVAHLFAFGDDTYKVKLETTAGNIVLEVHRDWAPIGAARFYELVRAGFYDNSRFFRVVAGRWAQFGIPGDPKLALEWREKTIPDDPRKESNTRGTFAFAMTGPGARTTQIFIALGDLSYQDKDNFAPLGRVVEGMDVADKLYSAYGEAAGGGMRGGKQGRIFAEGNAHLDRDFPKLDKLLRATILP